MLMLKAGKAIRKFITPSFSRFNFTTTTDPPASEQPISLYEKFKGFHNTSLENLNIPGVTIVNTKDKAKRALDVLMSLEDRSE